jgi:hypothetical protein
MKEKLKWVLTKLLHLNTMATSYHWHFVKYLENNLYLTLCGNKYMETTRQLVLKVFSKSTLWRTNFKTFWNSWKPWDPMMMGLRKMFFRMKRPWHNWRPWMGIPPLTFSKDGKMWFTKHLPNLSYPYSSYGLWIRKWTTISII